MEPPKPATHWSTHRWKLAGILAALPIVTELLHTMASWLLQRLFALFGAEDRTTLALLLLRTLSSAFILSVGALYALLAYAVLRAQADRGLEGRSQTQARWPTLLGLGIGMGVSLWSLASTIETMGTIVETLRNPGAWLTSWAMLTSMAH